MTKKPKDKNEKMSMRGFWRKNLGFEIWEILTALTMAVTLASSLLWFSNIAPKNAGIEFLDMDKYKNRVYNLSLRAERYSLGSIRALSAVESNDVCKSDTKIEPNNELYLKKRDAIKRDKEQFESLKKIYESNRFDTKVYENQKRLWEANNRLLVESELINEKKMYLSSVLIDIRKDSLVCKTKPDKNDFKDQINKVTELSEIIDKSENQDTKDVLELIASVRNSYEEVTRNDTFIFQGSEFESSLIELNNRVLAIQDETKLLDITLTTKEKAFEELQSYEDWQRSFLNKNYQDRNLVFITSV